ncbi:hypothetical protein BASA81_005133 [Batrachochytrium salamandrivorans]|nr:hypothetical protein BASA81_005133 [Batrachochytrium salamandrivorans]
MSALSSLGAFLFGLGAVFVLYTGLRPVQEEDTLFPVSPPLVELSFNDIAFPSSRSHQLDSPVAACLGNLTTCPSFAAGQLEQDFPVRFWKTNRGGCYFEFDSYSANCPEACQAVLVEGSGATGLALEVKLLANLACQIGCGFAKSAKSASNDGGGGKSCVMDCKRAKWPLNVPLVPGSFTLDKACELGCLVGNERPCPFCDTRAL